MKISTFLQDKLYILLSSLLASLTMVLFLRAVRCNVYVIIVILMLFWGVISAILIIEYIRRRVFYQTVNEVLNDLDQKYLLSEIIEEPQFIDGVFMVEYMREINKSMLEHVNEYRKREEDYRSYIEMWAHEIKTPLAAAKLISDNHQDDLMSSIQEEMDKVESFVEQALYYARSTTLEKDYIIKEMSLQPTVNKVVRKHAKQFIYRKIKLELQDLEVKVYSDAKWLEFILNQILSNALKYSKDESEIRIYTKQLQENVVLTIEDHGIGIALHELQRVFDKGFTGTNGRSYEKATGMGLYLCKQLCDKLYLDLKISSVEHIGTSVSIVFPMNAMLMLK